MNLSLLRSEAIAVIENGLERCNLAGLHKEGPQANECRWLLEVRKGKVRDSFIVSKKECSPTNILFIVQGIFIGFMSSITIRKTICIFAYMNKKDNVQNTQCCTLLPINHML